MSSATARKFIVTTTINAPTEAIMRYDEMQDWHLVVVGDKKTPLDYSLKRGTYISPDMQKELGYRCVDAIPWGKIQRRNIGLLYALHECADVIATIDDDNIPLDGWEKASDISNKNVLVPDGFLYSTAKSDSYDVVDPLSYVVTNERVTKLWHRGFPIQRLEQRDQIAVDRKTSVVSVGVQASLWNGEPDVDAICRIAEGPFDLTMQLAGRENNVCIKQGNYAPFNTQNTVMKKHVAAVLGLPYSIGRMDDIWAGYIAQKIMHHVDMSLIFAPPSVYQARNDHDLSRDLEAEMIGYRHTNAFLSTLNSIDLSSFGTKISIENMLAMYKHITSRLADLDFLDEEYKKFVDAWVYDVSNL